MHKEGGRGGTLGFPPEKVSPKVKSQYNFAANNNEIIRKEVERSKLSFKVEFYDFFFL